MNNQNILQLNTIKRQSIFMKYVSLVLGEDTSKYIDPISKKRSIAYTIAIHVPVLLWLAMGSTIAFNIFELSLLSSIAIGSFMALIIYLIERIIIASPLNWFSFISRLFIGLLIAILGSMGFDEIVFHKEIQLQVQQNAVIECKSITAIDLANKKALWLEADKLATAEMQGNGSGRVGLGVIAKEMLANAQKRKDDYDRAQILTTQANLECIETVVKSARLLTNIKTLWQLVSNERVIAIAWIIFGLLMVALELFVIIVKVIFNTPTVDDEIIATKNQIMLEHTFKNRDNIIETIKNPMF